MKNKRGWIRIVEAFISFLLVAGVLLILIDKGYFAGRDISEEVYEVQKSILREIELDTSLRADILEISVDKLPIAWENFKDTDEYNLYNTRQRIIERTPSYLTCEAKLCEMNKICSEEGSAPGNLNKDIYAQSVGITANLETYQPKQLKLFCWAK